MNTEKPSLNWATAEDAYHIINGLLAHVGAANDLIALFASLLGEAGTKALVETPQWADYMGTRRLMEQLKPELDKFSATMQELAKDRPDREEEE